MAKDVSPWKPRTRLTPGTMVRALRELKGWTQAQLGELVDMKVSNISSIENDRSRLGEDRAILLGLAFGVTPETILFPENFEREDLKPRIKKIKRRLEHMEGEDAA